MTTRILIVDDHRMIRTGLRSLLRSEPDTEVVGEADDGASAVRLAAQLAPDVVVMDVGLPDLNGVDATRRIVGAAAPPPRVVALSAYAEPRFVREMLRAGATAYVSKASAFEELARALRAVLAG
jgi:DNA-binding NarL/FixJ family response regulator